MCGIFGWSFNRKARIPMAQREALASVLAVANSLRGDDSWGAYMMNEQGKISIEREVGDIADKSGTAQWGHAPLVMAHTRAATVGAVSVPNSHPFEVGNIILAHNGAVYNHEDMNKKYDRKHEVDSIHLASHLAEGKPFSELEGYGAIEWVEQTKERRSPLRVHLARLAHGSLSVYGVEQGPWKNGKLVGVVWSSSEEHLKSAIGAARLNAFPFKAQEEGEVFYVQAGKYFSTKRPKLALSEATTNWGTRGVRYSQRGGWSGHASGGMYETWSWGESKHCKACDHMHDGKGKCYRYNCDCDDEKAKKKLAGKTASELIQESESVPFECGKCKHWHWEHGCAKSHCGCQERILRSEAGQSTSVVSSISTHKSTQLKKIADGVYVTPGGRVVEVSDLADQEMRDEENDLWAQMVERSGGME